MVGFFKIHIISPEHSGKKGVFMVRLSFDRPKLQIHTQDSLEPPTTSSLSSHRDDDLRNYEATYDMATMYMSAQ